MWGEGLRPAPCAKLPDAQGTLRDATEPIWGSAQSVQDTTSGSWPWTKLSIGTTQRRELRRQSKIGREV